MVKYKNKLKKLAARIKFWENLPKNVQSGYTKPGSEKK